jgi:CheY-like chemotaxis protein
VRNHAAAREPAVTATQLAPVLVVDDDESGRELNRRFLAKLGLRNPIETRSDGDAAIAFLDERVRTGAPPALAVLDVRLPGRSGLEVLRWIRSHPALHDLAVVMQTGSADLEDMTAARALGISAYLVKPVSYGTLGNVIRGLVDLPGASIDLEQAP